MAVDRFGRAIIEIRNTLLSVFNKPKETIQRVAEDLYLESGDARKTII